jgi:hypothetical protein
VIIVLVVLGGGMVILAAMSAVGRRHGTPTVTTEDLMREVQDLKQTVATGHPTWSIEGYPPSSALGATGPTGSVVASARTQATFQARATGVVHNPTRWERFKRFMGVGG